MSPSPALNNTPGTTLSLDKPVFKDLYYWSQLGNCHIGKDGPGERCFSQLLGKRRNRNLGLL